MNDRSASANTVADRPGAVIQSARRPELHENEKLSAAAGGCSRSLHTLLSLHGFEPLGQTNQSHRATHSTARGIQFDELR
jgi:hypothetical protein